MSGTDCQQIKTNVTMAGEILSFQMNQETNSHGSCILKGIVADGGKDTFVKENNSDKTIEIYLQNADGKEGKTVVFSGIAAEMSVYQEGELFYFYIKIYAHSFLLDVKKRNRSFQNAQMTYESLVKEIVSQYKGGDVIDRLSEGSTLKSPVIQYEETDWELLKRLVSHFHGSLLTAFEFGSPKIFFGATKHNDIGIMTRNSYSMEKQVFQYQTFSANGFSDYMETDALQFTIKDNRYFEIGSKVAYRDIPLYINQVKGDLVQGEVIFTYTLKTEKGMGQQRLCAGHLTGVSLPARVLKAVRDKIKVKFDMDDGQDVDTAWEFPYQTMYTAEGAGGFYCMPEVGDKVMIYFPGKEESDGVGTNSVREETGDKKRTANPEIKFFRTIYGKEIRFTKEAVEITCIEGIDEETGEEKKVKITLHQDDGIEISSSEGITFTSQKGIRLEAEEEIDLYASDKIELHCKKGKIRMDSMIDIAGPDVRIN